MTYCHLETEEIKRFKQNFLFDDLEKWFNELIHAYEKWAKFQIQWKKERDRTIQKTEFPFSYREGQREVVSSVYRTILRKKICLSRLQPESEKLWLQFSRLFAQ